jgi:hypothetical protein
LISVKAKVTLIEPAKAAELLQSWSESAPDGVRAAGPTEGGGYQHPPGWVVRLSRRLEDIEDKLDRILGKLGCEVSESLDAEIADTRDISGSGIGLILSEPIERGRMIEISMALPGMSVDAFHAYGEVVRISARSGKDKGLFDVAVKFLYINEAEREQLIACSFAAQRRSIRNASDRDDEH